ncbi:hypothetical protein BB560_002372 [Smittium megazygosporum]|uniref:Uncharacterized protein n=1 Tax=Smittium megazygosporum TaxID=133381 RepID=A0A2T9ZF44_9FUNG|nr:hypothetical protein BB560_002372 [Smittium megazygosporum]
MITTFGSSRTYIEERTANLEEYIISKDTRWVSEVSNLFRDIGIECETSYSNITSAGKVTTVHGIVRATRSDAVESIALCASTSTAGNEPNYSAVQLLIGLADEFSNAIRNWIDSHILFSDNTNYHKHRVTGLQAALSFEIPPLSSQNEFALYYEGKSGQLPNLDLLNIIKMIFGYNNMQTLHHGSKPCVTSDGSFLEKFNHYKCMSKNLLETLKWLAFGTSVGTHAPFLSNRIESVTIRGIPSNNRNDFFNTGYSRLGRAIESVVISINGLLERFHQSFFLYLLPENGKYISIADYSIPAILACVGILLQGIYIFSNMVMNMSQFSNLTKVEQINISYSKLALQPISYVLICLSMAGLSFLKRSKNLFSNFDLNALRVITIIYSTLYLTTLTIENYSLSIYFIVTVGFPLLFTPKCSFPGTSSDIHEFGGNGTQKNINKNSQSHSEKHDTLKGKENKATSYLRPPTRSLKTVFLYKFTTLLMYILTLPPLASEYTIPSLVNIGCEKISYCISKKDVLNWLLYQYTTYGSQVYSGLYMLQLPVNIVIFLLLVFS